MDQLFAIPIGLILSSVASIILIGGLGLWRTGDTWIGALAALASLTTGALIPLVRAYRRQAGAMCAIGAQQWEQWWALLSWGTSAAIGGMAVRGYLTSSDTVAHLLFCSLCLGGIGTFLRNYVRPRVIQTQLGLLVAMPSLALAATNDPAYVVLAVGGLALTYNLVQVTGSLFRSAVETLQKDEGLQRQNVLFQAALENMQHGLSMFDADKRLLACNDRYLQMFGFSADVVRPGSSLAEIVDHSISVGNHPADLRETLCARLAASFSDTAVTFEHRAGQHLAFSITNQPMVGGGGWVTTIEDITERVASEAAMRESEEHLRHTVELNPQFPWTASPQGELLTISQRWCDLTGLSLEEALGTNWLSSIHPEDLDHHRAVVGFALSTGAPFDDRFRCRSADGSYRWFRGRGAPRRDEHGNIVRWYGSSEDIHDQVLAEQAIQESEALNRSIVEASPDCVRLLDADGRVVFINGPGLRALEIDDFATVAGRPWAALWPEVARPALEQAVSAAQRGGVGRFSAACPTAKGAPKWWDVVVSPVFGDAGEVTKLVAVSRDMTQQKAAEQQVQWSATHDFLTELPNRTHFQQQLTSTLLEAESIASNVVLLHLDVDHFKQVNDVLGHDAGDRLLQTFAERLRSSIRSTDFVARLGGDEFAVLLPGLKQADLPNVADALLSRMREPFVYAGRVLDCRASIGASVYPFHGRSPDDLLKSADIALYVAKAEGRGGLRLYDPAMRTQLRERSVMINTARALLASDRIAPFYQPKIELSTNRISGFEALLRWREVDGSVGSPGSIAAAFEDLDLAEAISERMIQLTVADMRDWLERGVEFGHVAVNAAAAEFRNDGFAERVLEVLHAANVPPAAFQLEVTEQVFLGRGAECVERALRLLNREGVRIALDDFGTGYASLQHLKSFPVDIIKIDRSFVHDLEDGSESAAIVRAIVRLGHSLGIDIVAEGIETMAQAARLRRLRCRFGQGFLYSPALPGVQVPDLLVASGRLNPLAPPPSAAA